MLFTVIERAPVVNRAYAVYNAVSKRPISFTVVDKAFVVNRAYVVYSG